MTDERRHWVKCDRAGVRRGKVHAAVTRWGVVPIAYCALVLGPRYGYVATDQAVTCGHCIKGEAKRNG